MPRPKIRDLFRSGGFKTSTVTRADVKAAEQELGVSLPGAYLALLQIKNGGYVRRNAIRPERGLPAWFKQRTCRFYGIAGLGATNPGTLCERTAVARRKKWFPAGLIPFDDGFGRGWFMCLDYRHHGPRAEPSITRIHGPPAREFTVAASFGDLLSRLEIGCEEFVFALDTARVRGRRLDQRLSDLGCKKWKGMIKRPDVGAWNWPAFRQTARKPAVLFVSANGQDDPWLLARPARHLLLQVQVREAEQEECLAALTKALGPDAPLILRPPGR